MKVLLYGSKGTDVELTQLALSRSGYYKGDIDGCFGRETLNSVRRFQADFSLVPDGIVGEKTLIEIEPFLLGSFTHTVRGGDTAFSLAKRFGTTTASIAAANPGLDPDRLSIGQRLTIPYGFDIVPTNIRYTPRFVELVIDGLRTRYPFIENSVYGRSVIGNDLNCISFGKGEKELLFNASHHANEWITTPLVLKFAEAFLKAYVNGGTLLGRDCRSLFERVKLYIAPLVNPDGVALVNADIDMNSNYYLSAKKIASAYPTIPFPSGWKANIEGTDLNLNYPAGWDEAKRIKYALGYTSPAPRDFVGASPLSSAESRALYEFTLAHDFLLTISYHTQGMEIYWKYGEIEPERGREIGGKMAELSGYTLENVPPESANAGYKDWFIQNYKLPGYTVEAGRGQNPLPLNQFDEIYSDNLGIMLTALELA